MNAEINLADDDNGFRSTLGSKHGAENQEFCPWLRLGSGNVCFSLVVIFVERQPSDDDHW